MNKNENIHCFSACLFKTPPVKAQSALIGLFKKYGAAMQKVVVKLWVEILRQGKYILMSLTVTEEGESNVSSLLNRILLI